MCVACVCAGGGGGEQLFFALFESLPIVVTTIRVKQLHCDYAIAVVVKIPVS